MTTEISKETRLLGLVAAYPACDRAVCALERAGKQFCSPNELGPDGHQYPGMWRAYYRISAALGFSDQEAGGIMTGWDIASGRIPQNEVYCDRPGFTLGVKCWEVAQKLS